MADNQRPEEFAFKLSGFEFCNSERRSGDNLQGKNSASCCTEEAEVILSGGTDPNCSSHIARGDIRLCFGHSG